MDEIEDIANEIVSCGDDTAVVRGNKVITRRNGSTIHVAKYRERSDNFTGLCGMGWFTPRPDDSRHQVDDAFEVLEGDKICGSCEASLQSRLNCDVERILIDRDTGRVISDGFERTN